MIIDGLKSFIHDIKKLIRNFKTKKTTLWSDDDSDRIDKVQKQSIGIFRYLTGNYYLNNHKAFSKKEIMNALPVDERIVDECLNLLIKKEMITNKRKFKINLDCALFMEDLIKREINDTVNLFGVLSTFSTLILAIAGLLNCYWITVIAATFSITTFIFMLITLADK